MTTEFDRRITHIGRVVSVIDRSPWGIDEKSAYILVGNTQYELRERKYDDVSRSLRGFRIDDQGIRIAQGPRVTRSLALVAWPDFDPGDASDAG